MPVVKEKFAAITANPDPFWFLASRKERLKKYPVRSLRNAIARRAIHSSINLGFMKKVVRAKTFWGEKIFIPSRSAFHLFEKGFFDGEDFRLTGYIINTLREGDVFIDGGANIGWYTMIASDLVGDRGQVHSFEATERTFEILKANVAARKNVRANRLALWEKEGVVSFSDFGFKFDVANTVIQEKERIDYYEKLVTHNPEYRVVSVPAVTLDGYCTKNDIKPTFIKLDCEGAEFEILSAAENVLKHRPTIACEILGSSLRSGAGAKLVRALGKFGYSPYAIRDDFSVEPLDMEGKFELVNAIFKTRP